MISTKYNFLFIHIPKNAGSSVNAHLNRYYDKIDHNRKITILDQNLDNIRDAKRSINYGEHFHLTIKDWENFFIRDSYRFEKIKKIAIIREPYNRIYSYFSYRKMMGLSKKINFKTFIMDDIYKLNVLQETDYHRMYQSQLHWIINKNEKLPKNMMILRFDNINDEMIKLQNNLELPNDKILHLNKSKKKNIFKRFFNQKYNLEMKKKIYQNFIDDFKFFRFPKNF